MIIPLEGDFVILAMALPLPVAPFIGCKWQHKGPCSNVSRGFRYAPPWRQLEGDVVIFDMVFATALPFPLSLFTLLAGFGGRDGREFEGLAASVRLVVGGLDGNLKLVLPRIHGELARNLCRVLG